LHPSSKISASNGLGIDASELDAETERRELRKHGGDRKSEKVKDQADNVSLKHGNQSSYILARLERDGIWTNPSGR
jgi:hypothetical protein